MIVGVWMTDWLTDGLTESKAVMLAFSPFFGNGMVCILNYPNFQLGTKIEIRMFFRFYCSYCWNSLLSVAGSVLGVVVRIIIIQLPLETNHICHIVRINMYSLVFICLFPVVVVVVVERIYVCMHLLHIAMMIFSILFVRIPNRPMAVQVSSQWVSGLLFASNFNTQYEFIGLVISGEIGLLYK